jgi:hypothetical protein
MNNTLLNLLANDCTWEVQVNVSVMLIPRNFVKRMAVTLVGSNKPNVQSSGVVLVWTGLLMTN